jgi:hypothetical protein
MEVAKVMTDDEARQVHRVELGRAVHRPYDHATISDPLDGRSVFHDSPGVRRSRSSPIRRSPRRGVVAHMRSSFAEIVRHQLGFST